MENRIYFAGSTNRTEKDAWREKLYRLLTESCENCRIDNFFYMEATGLKEFVATRIRISDILIVNVDTLNDDVCAVYDVAIADEINRSGNKRIYILGFGKSEVNIRIESCLMVKLQSIYELVDFMLLNDILR